MKIKLCNCMYEYWTYHKEEMALTQHHDTCNLWYLGGDLEHIYMSPSANKQETA